MAIRRKIETKILNNLKNDKVILLIGARQVGKTTLLKTVKESLKSDTYFFTFEDPSFLSELNKHPDNLFKFIRKSDKKIFLFLDEIQYLDDPSNFMKYIYDMYQGEIKLIATGSSAFYIDRKFKDSLAGRKKIIHVSPFCFSEFLMAKNRPDLAQVIEAHHYFAELEKKNLLIPEKQELKTYWDEYSIYGGYPEVVLKNDLEEKKALLKELHISLLKKDILESRIQDEKKFYNLIRIIARQCGELLNLNELANTLGLSYTAIENYIYVLEKSFIIKTLSPFHRNIRKELTKMPKVFMFDNGYRNSLLNSFQTIPERVDAGETLENMFFSELIKLDAENIHFWRTQDKNEVDFIIDEKWAFEIKVNNKKFSYNKYKKFMQAYPEIDLNPVSLNDGLEILDFSS